jgi:hypothetical protein
VLVTTNEKALLFVLGRVRASGASGYALHHSIFIIQCSTFHWDFSLFLYNFDATPQEDGFLFAREYMGIKEKSVGLSPNLV